VQWFVTTDSVENSVHEVVTALVVERAEKDASGEVFVVVGVTARTAERAFASDLDREKRNFPAQNFTPTLQEVPGVYRHRLLTKLDFIFRHFGGVNGCMRTPIFCGLRVLKDRRVAS
jgi:hypothetical protein